MSDRFVTPVAELRNGINVSALTSAGARLRESGLLDEADRVLGAAIDLFPDDEHSAIEHAWVASRRGDWDEALARWKRMQKRHPLHFMGFVGVGEALRELGRFDEAELVLTRATVRFPELEIVWIQRAWVSTHREDWNLAVDRWTEVAKLFPKCAIAKFGLVEALIKLSRLTDAATALADARLLFPNDSQSSDRLENSLQEARNYAATSPIERVQQKIRDSGVEASLADAMDNPEILIEITSICNFQCGYCVSPMKLRTKTMMSMERYEEIIDQVSKMTTKPIRLHVDGEPTTHPKFRDMAKLVNEKGLPIWLATNGSHLDIAFLDIWMDLLISMSTSPEELAKRHPKLSHYSYIDKIARYANAWANSESPQNLMFQIVFYPQGSKKADASYRQSKEQFIAEFCRRAGLYESCVEDNLLTDDNYRLLRKSDGKVISFIKQTLTMGGIYPVDGQLISRPLATEGFCDSVWRMLVIHADGSLGGCCSDLSGGTTFASADDVKQKTIRELWRSSPQIQKIRQSFLDGHVEREVCQRCLTQEQVLTFVTPE